ncbi:MAG: hypothetical protein MK082_04425 [Phycisphaerales bacterium]|nr:hypothetical protein [Phycisphaerales bacterium]
MTTEEPENTNPVDAIEHAVRTITQSASNRAERHEESSRRLRVDTANEEERHGTDLDAIEQRNTEGIEGAKSAHERAIEEARKESGGKLASLEDEYETRRKRILERADKTIKSLKKRYDEKLWLAETVFDANEQKPRREFEELRGQIDTRLQEIDELEEFARREMRQYRQRASVPAGIISEEDRTHLEQDPLTALANATANATEGLAALRALKFARIFRGGVPFVALLFLAGLGAGAGIAYQGGMESSQPIVIGSIAGLIVCIVLLVIGWTIAARQVSDPWGRFIRAITGARSATELILERAQAERSRLQDELVRNRDREIALAEEKYPPMIKAAEEERESLLEDLESRAPKKRSALESHRDMLIDDAEQTLETTTTSTVREHGESLSGEHERHKARMQEIADTYESEQEDIHRTWHTNMRRSHATIDALTSKSVALHPDFKDEAWKDWRPRDVFPELIRFGSLDLDLSSIEHALPEEEAFKVDMPPRLELPAFVGFPDPCSLLIECDHEGRRSGIDLAKSLMLRLIATMPPGKIRFTIVDPVGLGEPFAGFMHLADHDEQLVNDRIWTEARHIEQRLLDLTEHMETVIQKYLRNEFKSIIDYNEAAGEIAEPLRFLVVCDFPANFTDVAAKRLAAIATSGPRCGVYTIVIRDTRREMPEALDIATLRNTSVTTAHVDGSWSLEHGSLKSLPLTPDPAPPDELVTEIANKVGAASIQAGRVEVPFDVIAPDDEEYWTASSEKKLTVSLGRSGATKLQQMVLGVGTAQHALIAGKTGSGKSTLLHALITNLACWYSPDEVEFWLVDFKKGVEFKTYATHRLPHARAVAVESDREFGLSVLRGLDDVLKQRGDLFRTLGVQDIPGYRNSGHPEPMPRVLLIVDEFQELFVEDDKIAQDASLLLDRLVRQGRAFGIHIVLGSQTLAGAYSLARSTMGQMGVRVALQCSENDSQIILSDDNSAARLLSRPGEAIYNDQSGLLEGNSPFQVCWLDEEVRDRRLGRVEELANERGHPIDTIVFEGSRPASLAEASVLAEAIENRPTELPVAPSAWLGEAVAIKDPTATRFRRQAATNLLILGQSDDSAMALSTGTLLSLASQYRSDQASFTVLDGSPADDPAHGMITELAEALPHHCTIPNFREADEAILAVGTELARRVDGAITDAPASFLLIHGLQRFRSLRRSEDDFGYSLDEDDKPPTPDKVLATILREGPIHGVHVITWCDTVTSLQRCFDRQGIGEFDQRALFQIGATDSSTLIDSPAASRLGFNRALLFSEEQGTMEKFRPWTMPERSWLKAMAERITTRESGS